MKKAILALEDGSVFEGVSFGASGTTVGELCFNTSSTGYQEALTDPTYRGQIIAMTYPVIGNYGINSEDNESSCPQVRGLIVEELSKIHSNWRANSSLEEWLEKHNIIAIQGIDTRKITKLICSKGSLKACISTKLEQEQAIENAKSSPSLTGTDLVQEVSTEQAYHWEEECPDLILPNGSADANKPSQPTVKYRIAAYDLGVKRSVLRSLRKAGFDITVINAKTNAEDILTMGVDGLFLSNGPGDSAELDYIHQEITKLLGKLPIFGMALGMQVLAHAMGAKTLRLPVGHRGSNQPVKNVATNYVSLTSQNHDFTIDSDTLPKDVEVTHINVNDDTIEGIRHKTYPASGVQFLPSASPDESAATSFFETFTQLIEQFKTV